MSVISSIRGVGSRKVRLLTVLDVGSSKISCVIARLRPLEKTQYLPGRTHRMEVLGFGIQKSRGVKSGIIVDLSAAEEAIRLTVDAAERMAGLVVDSLIVNFSGRGLKSERISAEVGLSDQTVSAFDIRHVVAKATQSPGLDHQTIIHSLPVSFMLDGEQDVADPLDMMGTELAVKMHRVAVDTAPLRNLEYCINRAHLSVERVVVTPFASGLSILVGDEAQLGAACIDLGGETTAISVFHKGNFVFTETFALGGHHITLDIARGLSIPVEEAERLKVIHGSVFLGNSDDKFVHSTLNSGDQSFSQYPLTLLSRIIRARIEEIIELVRDRLLASGFAPAVGKRLILTGGGSQLTGLSEIARYILGSRLRIGRPLGISGLPDMARGSAFATVVGLLIYPQTVGFDDQTMRPSVREKLVEKPLSRAGRWLRRSF